MIDLTGGRHAFDVTTSSTGITFTLNDDWTGNYDFIAFKESL